MTNQSYSKDELLDLTNDGDAKVDFIALYTLSECEDPEIRLLVAELLARDTAQSSEAILINLIKDDDELVRSEACDALSYYKNQSVLETLEYSLLNDPSETVRSYALLSYWDVYSELYSEDDKKIIGLYNRVYFKDESEIVRVHCAGLLYSKGDMHKIDYLYQMINHNNPYVRNAVIDNLVKISNDENIQAIQKKLSLLCRGETVEFIKFKIDAILLYEKSDRSEY